jgi:tetratricopeptide (TPR) repeat protein
MSFLLACQSGPTQKEEKAIVQAVQDEMNGYIKRDHAKWSSQWVHEPYANLTNVQNGWYHCCVGWDSIDAFLKPHFADTSAYVLKHKKSVVQFQNYGKTAFVSGEEIVQYPDSANTTYSCDVAIWMEKRNGRWLFAGQFIFVKSSFSMADQAIEDNLNMMGYQLLLKNRLKDAIAVLSLNVQLFPGSSNVYDSLGEAYMKAGQKELAIQNYEKSLKLNSKNENAVEMLKKLRVK